MLDRQNIAGSVEGIMKNINSISDSVRYINVQEYMYSESCLERTRTAIDRPHSCHERPCAVKDHIFLAGSIPTKSAIEPDGKDHVP